MVVIRRHMAIGKLANAYCLISMILPVFWFCVPDGRLQEEGRTQRWMHAGQEHEVQSLMHTGVRKKGLTLDVARGEDRGLEVLRELLCRNTPGLMRIPLELAAPVGDLRQQLISAAVGVVAPRPRIAVVVRPACTK